MKIKSERGQAEGRKWLEVEYIVVKLSLESDFEIFLKNTFYIPFSLDRLGFGFDFCDEKVNLMFNSLIVGYGILNDGLYKLYLAYDNPYASLNVENIITKYSRIKDRSSMLWHEYLGYISKERIDRLIKDDILPILDFEDMEPCIDCIRDKLSKTKKKEEICSSGLLEIIHTDISGPYSSIIYDNKYFITFIDDFFDMIIFI